ncbi:hypothetical protein QVD17_27483 [Tagetes erecta]|uniref:Uncharacterized protein n=1 Tax=Tagetes erecta TaxID=13708 RepID=A0AAD8K8J8_TARER|nr:hypothetical protein QVD17_27483 [Tagetes erecta]
MSPTLLEDGDGFGCYRQSPPSSTVYWRITCSFFSLYLWWPGAHHTTLSFISSSDSHTYTHSNLTKISQSSSSIHTHLMDRFSMLCSIIELRKGYG